MDNSVERFKSALVCAMVGDATGWVTEFQSTWFKDNIQMPVKGMLEWERQTGGRWYRHLEQVELGEYSDDTQLMLATLRCLKYSNWYSHLAFTEFPLWTLYARGAGRACKNSASILSVSKFPWNSTGKKLEDYYNSGGNGGVMRILPHLFDAKDDREDLLCMALANSLLTHGHSNSIVGTLLYADTLHCIYTGVEKENLCEELSKRVKEYRTYLTKTLDMLTISGYMVESKFKIKCWDMNDLVLLCENKLKGMMAFIENSKVFSEMFDYCGITATNRGSAIGNALASIVLYLRNNKPYEAIYQATNSLICDTDTLASMSGALLGLNCNLDELPVEFKQVVDYDLALHLVDELVSTPKESTPVLRLKPAKVKDYLFSGDVANIDLGGVLGKLTVESTRLIRSLVPNIEVTQKILKREDGQRMYIKKMSKV